MNNLQVFENEQLNLQVRTIQNEDGSISINAEDAAIGFGWTRTKNNKTYVMWDRINGFIEELNFPHMCGKDDYIPESLFYMLGMKANNKVAQDFQKWLAVDVIPQIRQTGGYIPQSENETEEDILAKAILIAQRTIEKKNQIIESQKPLVNFANKVATSENSLLVREVAKLASKEGVAIGERRLWQKLREWGFIFKHTTEPKQCGIDKGYFEVVEGTRENSKGVFTYKTTRVTGKGQIYIISRLVKEL